MDSRFRENDGFSVPVRIESLWIPTFTEMTENLRGVEMIGRQ